MEKQIKIGVLGISRGRTMIDYCKHDKRVKLAAVCDSRKDELYKTKEQLGDDSIEYYQNFEDMLNSYVDGIVLANYANEHAPFAIRCLKRGKPVKATGFEFPYNERMARMGAKAGWGAMIVVTLENGAVLKSVHGVGPSKNSVWYSVYGSLGTVESGRECAQGSHAVYSNLDYYEGENIDRKLAYNPVDVLSAKAAAAGHGGSDFYTMWNFASKILGEKDAEIIDVYEALDMFLPGLCAYRSVLNGGIPMEVPDFRDKAQREKYRFDFACTDAKVAGSQLQPSYSKGNPQVPDEVYEKARKEYLNSLNR